MAKNSKPILSVLIDEDKRTRFADLARRHSLSMGYLVNKAVDRMLELDSIDIYGESTKSPHVSNTSILSADTTDIENLVSLSIDKLDIESLVKTSIDAYLLNHPIGVDDIERLVNTSIDKLGVESLVNTSIGLAIEPITQAVTELETYTRERFEELEARSIEKPKPAKTTPKKSENEPEWVNGDNRSFYNLFSEDANLLIKVTEAIELHSGSNDELSKVLADIGIHKQDGTPLASSPISRIKTLVKRMNGTEAADNTKQ